ncbi:MAG: aminopeptidase, partial [Clostridia bacterium]
MITKKQLKNYAKLAIKLGVNLQKGQELIINSPVESAEFARLATEEAYKAGAKRVWVKWMDDTVSRINMENQSIETLQDFPQYLIDEAHYQVDNRFAYLFVSSTDPELYSKIPQEKLKASQMARIKAIRFSVEARSSNLCRWTIVSVPTVAWAKKIFPNANTAHAAIDLLWTGIIKSMRLDTVDPIKAWEDHIAHLSRRAEFLNENNFHHIHMINEKGTDLNVALAKNHIWMAAGEKAQDGIDFTANMPTEEVFTAPDKYNVNGVLVNALPLCHNGNIIDDFSISFKDGRITDFSAKVGYDTLKQAIETDEGSHHLGEIALIGKNSPIAMQHILYYNTLFDENAS